MVDGALVRVSPEFDETEGSDDMVALRELLAAMRDRVPNETPAFITKHGQGRSS